MRSPPISRPYTHTHTYTKGPAEIEKSFRLPREPCKLTPHRAQACVPTNDTGTKFEESSVEGCFVAVITRRGGCLLQQRQNCHISMPAAHDSSKRMWVKLSRGLELCSFPAWTWAQKRINEWQHFALPCSVDVLCASTVTPHTLCGT